MVYISGFSGLMVLLIRFLASVIVWVILAVAIVGSIGKDTKIYNKIHGPQQIQVNWRNEGSLDSKNVQ